MKILNIQSIYGEWQCVIIAWTLVFKPTIILVAEPTGNLDENTGIYDYEKCM